MTDQLFARFRQMKVAVVGDLMLDTYWWGSANRISPEAPVPVVALRNRENRIGGAGNVALNLRSLGASVAMYGIVGKDQDGEMLTGLLNRHEIQTPGILYSDDRITTNKIRIISRSQHLLRIDQEDSRYLNADEEEKLLGVILPQLEKQRPDILIFEDYNKGVLTENLIKSLLKWSRSHGIVTAVDPKRRHFFAYQGVDIFKPNLKEVSEALNLPEIPASESALREVHRQLYHQLQHKVSLITLSEKGVFVQENDDSAMVPAHVRNIADVSGAGDTVIAVAALVYAATGNVQRAAEMANLAGGLVCEEIGTVAIDAGKLQAESRNLSGLE